MQISTRRGFTFHEQLDSTQLVHMNGRLYDPFIARFLSADPNIQAPLFSQSLNRYSYALNSPLNYTDPTGFWFDDLDWDWWDGFWLTIDWDLFFGGEKRETEGHCADPGSFRCAVFERGARAFLECGFNAKCLRAWIDAHPLDPPTDTPPDEPPPDEPPPPTDEPPPPTDEPPPAEPPQPTPTVPEPDATDGQSSSGTESGTTAEKPPQLRPPGVRLPGLPGEDTYVTSGPVTDDNGVQWYTFSAQPDYGFDQSIIDYAGDPSKAFKAVSDSVRLRPNPEDEKNRLFRSVSVSTEGGIETGLTVDPPVPDIKVPDVVVTEPTINFDPSITLEPPK